MIDTCNKIPAELADKKNSCLETVKKTIRGPVIYFTDAAISGIKRMSAQSPISAQSEFCRAVPNIIEYYSL